MTDVTYEVDYPDPSYIKEALSDSRRGLSTTGVDPLTRCSCFKKIKMSLVKPWSNHIDWWYRCGKCGNIFYAYDCQDEDNDNVLQYLMKEEGFKFNEKDFLEHIEKFLRKMTK